MTREKFSHEKDKVSSLFCMVQRSWWEIKDRKQLIILLAGTGAQSSVTLYQKPLENCNKLGAPAWGLILGWQRGVVLFRSRQEECTCLEYTCVFSCTHLSPCGSSFWHLTQHRISNVKFLLIFSPPSTPDPHTCQIQQMKRYLSLFFLMLPSYFVPHTRCSPGLASGF